LQAYRIAGLACLPQAAIAPHLHVGRDEPGDGVVLADHPSLLRTTSRDISRERRRIGRVELRRAEGWERNARSMAASEVPTELAVPVKVAIHMGWLWLRHRTSSTSHRQSREPRPERRTRRHRGTPDARSSGDRRGWAWASTRREPSCRNGWGSR